MILFLYIGSQRVCGVQRGRGRECVGPRRSRLGAEPTLGQLEETIKIPSSILYQGCDEDSKKSFQWNNLHSLFLSLFCIFFVSVSIFFVSTLVPLFHSIIVDI